MGAEAEVRRERKGAGWAEEGRRGVGGLVERGSGAVWRYAGCLCGLSRGLIRYDSPQLLQPGGWAPPSGVRSCGGGRSRARAKPVWAFVCVWGAPGA